MINPNINPRLIDLAGEVVFDFNPRKLYLERDERFVEGTIYWSVASGFEIIAEVEAWGRSWPATLYYPPEQDTQHIASLHFNTFKIQEVADRLLDYGFVL